MEGSLVFAGREIQQCGRPSSAYRTAEAPSDKWIRHASGVDGASGQTWQSLLGDEYSGTSRHPRLQDLNTLPVYISGRLESLPKASSLVFHGLRLLCGHGETPDKDRLRYG